MARKFSEEEYKKRFPNLKPFPPGVSGNKAGRPPSKISITSAVKELLQEPAPESVLEPLRRRGMIPEAWKDRVITWRDVKALRNLIAAISPKGDTMSREVWLRVDGRVPFQITGLDEGPIELVSYDLEKLTVEELKIVSKLLYGRVAGEEGEIIDADKRSDVIRGAAKKGVKKRR